MGSESVGDGPDAGTGSNEGQLIQGRRISKLRYQAVIRPLILRHLEALHAGGRSVSKELLKAKDRPMSPEVESVWWSVSCLCSDLGRLLRIRPEPAKLFKYVMLSCL